MNSGGVGMYIHNFSEMGEPTPSAIADTFVKGGVSSVRFKVFQWLSWNGTPKAGGYDTSPYGITSTTAVVARCDDFRSRGIRPIPWCVPMGLDVEAEAQRAAGVARVAGAIDFDLEPYADFWPALPKGDYSAIVPFFSRVRDLAPDAEITLDFPARDTTWEWGIIRHAVQLAAPFVDRFALQSYFGLAQAEDAERRVAALDTGKPIDHIVTPPMIAADLGAYMGGTQATRLLIWLARDMDAAAYARLGAITLLPDGPPQPQPVPAAAWQAPGFAALRAKVGATMGDPSGDAYPDSLGNVWQESLAGSALWRKRQNRNYFLPNSGDPCAL